VHVLGDNAVREVINATLTLTQRRESSGKRKAVTMFRAGR
jgi:predicted amidohydrolase YtcJ